MITFAFPKTTSPPDNTDAHKSLSSVVRGCHNDENSPLLSATGNTKSTLSSQDDKQHHSTASCGAGTFHSYRTVETVLTLESSSSSSLSSQHQQQEQYPSLERSFIAPEEGGSDPHANPLTGSLVVFETDDDNYNPSSMATLEPPVQIHTDGGCRDQVDDILPVEYDHEYSPSYYLEMGLTRNCSILPNDVVDAATMRLETINDLKLQQDMKYMAVMQSDGNEDDQSEEDKDVEMGDNKSSFCEESSIQKKNIPISAYFLLLSAVFSLSAIGPFLQLQNDVSPTMKIVWRQLATSGLLFPLAIWDLWQPTKKAEDLVSQPFSLLYMTLSQWKNFVWSTVSYEVFSLCFVMALNFTAVGNAVILSNSLALLLLIGKIFRGDHVSFMAGAGAIVAFSGALLCSRDSADQHGSSNGLWGDGLALLSAFGGVGYLVFAKKTREHMPMYLFMFLTMFIGTFLLVFFQIVILGETVSFDTNVQHGVLGFLVWESDRLPLELAMAFVCNCFGTMGYVRSMMYFDNLVISSATLLEPVVAEFMALALGVGSLPGFQGFCGNFLVAAGTFAVIYQDSVTKETKSSS